MVSIVISNDAAIAFNRTIVELKYIGLSPETHTTESFNRTIVELKYPKLLSGTRPPGTFNRTIVELKFLG